MGCSGPGYGAVMTEPTTVYHPGQIFPVSGIYRCDKGDDPAHRYESTDVKGHRFPPVPHGCAGAGWVLERASAHH